MMLLLYKTYLVLFVDQYKPPRNRLNCEQVLKISGCRVYSVWKIVPLSYTKFVQFVQNQNVIIVKLA